MEEFLRDISDGKSTLEGGCNAGTVSTNTKGWYGDFEVWLNKKEIANLLLIPMLEAPVPQHHKGGAQANNQGG